MILINECVVSDISIEILKQVELIFNKFILGEFFKQDEYLTPFNNYFIEKMPNLFEFLNDICNIELPSFIDDLINDKLNWMKISSMIISKRILMKMFFIEIYVLILRIYIFWQLML